MCSLHRVCSRLLNCVKDAKCWRRLIIMSHDSDRSTQSLRQRGPVMLHRDDCIILFSATALIPIGRPSRSLKANCNLRRDAWPQVARPTNEELTICQFVISRTQTINVLRRVASRDEVCLTSIEMSRNCHQWVTCPHILIFVVCLFMIFFFICGLFGRSVANNKDDAMARSLQWNHHLSDESRRRRSKWVAGENDSVRKVGCLLTFACGQTFDPVHCTWGVVVAVLRRPTNRNGCRGKPQTHIL